jgi:hypothetical protein
LRDEDFDDVDLPKDLREWVPKKDESSGVIADQVAAWQDWWKVASAKAQQ